MVSVGNGAAWLIGADDDGPAGEDCARSYQLKQEINNKMRKVKESNDHRQQLRPLLGGSHHGPSSVTSSLRN